ncbi:ThiF family protein [Apiospora rasikravindrae]|uniref:NEDD8-activating enzyme E1 regulatory subunit n=1 Tax=Apiospora rasikravindrae TaxID=990691 RepID=A0ABR1TXM3_9PEZI
MTEIVMSQTPPILHGPSDKEKKYDRQLRLWAASGQAALESANILLVNSGCGTVGVETLKNLVLPGIGRFTIVDEAVVQNADLGVNFFLDETCLGKLRSKCCTELLQELNPDVQGEWFPKQQGTVELDQVLLDSPTYTLIMYTMPISPKDLAALKEYGQQHHTPLVAIHSAGFYSYFNIQLPGTFPIVDTHPEAERTIDLRLTKPWPELAQFAEEMTKDMDQLDDHEHGHLPYVVLLLHYLEKWKETHDGKLPTEYKAKLEFRETVAKSARTNNPEGGEENFQEAVAAVNRNIKEQTLESTLAEVFSHEASGNVNVKSSFWVIAGAIKEFHKKHGCLPLPGGLPDMKAQSSVYVKLQGLYKAKARKDSQEVLEIAKSLSDGRDVDSAEVDLFCKNASFVKLVNATTGDQDLKEQKANDSLAEVTMMPLSLFPIYLALSATTHEPTASVDQIKASVHSRLPAAADDMRVVQACEEVARAAGGELHNISALTGGMVAQEAIKIITKQYIPIDNTCIFDGIASRCQVLRL